MTPEEKFSFDLEGYIVLKNVLSREELDELNAVADREFPRDYNDGNEFKGFKGVRRASRVTLWDRACQNLIDHPEVLPYLQELLGPKFRLDHDYCIFMTKGGTRGNLHGGPGLGDHWYKYLDGEMRNGLTVCTFFLSPAGPGDGGFSCVPRSHKTNFRKNLPEDVRQFKRSPHYVVQPEVEAGDALIFTEALIHGTLPWNGDHERKALLYKYSPGHSSWSQNYYNPEEEAFDNLTEQQKRIMASPSVGNRPNSVELA